MYNYRACVAMLLLHGLSLIHEFYKTSGNLRYFTLHCGPAMVLELCDHQVLIALVVGDDEFSAGVIRTTL